ncbi:hypothetical protein FB45DRAFT_1018623 [Roridomyces roridus]|uniref:DUF3533 domain-containing protein n=1 Tax=Roridomyces roridus TaxID=1738132 RepID=A0AAD7CL35_9AGAR|nr:hypothetical protein FB45DRAFT_1018623 [Roridomyces roridus]
MRNNLRRILGVLNAFMSSFVHSTRRDTAQSWHFNTRCKTNPAVLQDAVYDFRKPIQSANVSRGPLYHKPAKPLQMLLTDPAYRRATSPPRSRAVRLRKTPWTLCGEFTLGNSGFWCGVTVVEAVLTCHMTLSNVEGLSLTFASPFHESTAVLVCVVLATPTYASSDTKLQAISINAGRWRGLGGWQPASASWPLARSIDVAPRDVLVVLFADECYDSRVDCRTLARYLRVKSGASANLTMAVAAVDGSYKSCRVHKAIAAAQLDAITHQFALQFIANLSTSANAATLLSSPPQLVARPIYYTIANLRPFDVPIASAVTFVGLIYLVILSFFVVMLAATAREASGFEALAYFFIALIYTLLSRVFHLPFDRRFGSAGFDIFWMLNWLSMLACGLALEAMLTLLTQRFVPFFLMLWIISNVLTSVFPIQVLPHVYRDGYAFPFYNVSRAIRAIIFGTKNDLGLNFGVLIARVVLLCGTVALFQWFVRRRAVEAGKTVEG